MRAARGERHGAPKFAHRSHRSMVVAIPARDHLQWSLLLPKSGFCGRA